MTRARLIRLVKDVVLVLALLTLLFQFFAFSEFGRAVAKDVTDVFVTNTTSDPVPVTGSVGITAAQPIQVLNANDGTQPYARTIQLQFDGTATFGNNNARAFGDFTVPAGKRFVIETAGYRTGLQVGQRLTSVEIQTQNEADQGLSLFPIVPVDTGVDLNGQQNFEGLASLRVYSQPGGSITIAAFRAGTNLTDSPLLFVSVSGYLVDAP